MEKRGDLFHVHDMIEKGHLRGAWTTIHHLIDRHPTWAALTEVRDDIRTRLQAEIQAVRSAPDYVPPSIL